MEKRTQSNVFRMVSAQGEVPCIELSIFPPSPKTKRERTYHAPKMRKPNVTPGTLYLALCVQPPDWLEAGASLWSEYRAHRVSRFSKAVCSHVSRIKNQSSCNEKRDYLPGRENHSICVERAPIRKL
jgi:hypothetical protein